MLIPKQPPMQLPSSPATPAVTSPKRLSPTRPQLSGAVGQARARYSGQIPALLGGGGCLRGEAENGQRDMGL